MSALPDDTASFEREYTTPRFACPCCGTEIQFDLSMKMKVIEARPFTYGPGDLRPGEERKEEDLGRLNSYFEGLDAAPVLDAFIQVVGEVNIDHPPNNPVSFFRQWIAAVKATHLPKWALDQFTDEFGPAYVSYIQALGIGAVITDGRIRRFIPHRTIVGKRAGMPGGPSVRLGGTPEQLKTWTRTRYGYVVGNGAALDALRKPSIGAFAK